MSKSVCWEKDVRGCGDVTRGGALHTVLESALHAGVNGVKRGK